MSERILNPQGMIIKELIDRSSYNLVYDLSTLQFLKMHASDINHQLHYISCCALNGEQHWLYIVMELEGVCWEVGTVWPTTPRDQSKLLELQDLPRAALACVQGWGMIQSFCAFGEVIEKDLPIKTVRLVSANGLTLEDQVEQGLVLFIKNDDVLDLPIWAELYDEKGICVNRHLLFDVPGKRS